jgi:hypothetical protein
MIQRVLTILLILSTLPPMGAAAQIPRRGEFQINVSTTGSQRKPSVAVAPNGDFVVAWLGPGVAGSGNDIFARRFGPSGVPIGPEIVVNAWTTLDQDNPNVVSTINGQFVVVWSGAGYDDSSGIWGRVINPFGNAVGEMFRINAYTTGFQTDPAVAADAAGNITVAWSGNAGAFDFDGIAGRRMTSTGLPLTGQFGANTHVAGVQIRPAVASMPDGQFMVFWQGDGQGNGSGIMARPFNASAQPTVPMQIGINSYAANNQIAPAAAVDASGSVFVAWDSDLQDGSSYGVHARRYHLPTNAYAGDEFRVNTYTTSLQNDASVAQYGGNYVLVWSSNNQDHSAYGVYGQEYNGSFQKVGGEFQVHSHTTLSQSEASIAANAGGNWVVAWTGSGGQDGDNNGIFAQQYAPDRIFDNGFETGGLGAWSLSSMDGGDLSVTAAAALTGALGLQAVVDDTAGIWVADETPVDEDRYRAQFYFDPNGFDPGEALDHRRVMLLVVFEDSPYRRLATIILRRLNGAYAVSAQVRLDDHTLVKGPFFPISDGEHFIQLDWKRSSHPDAEDGSFDLWLDGSPVYSVDNLDNNLSAVDSVRMGAITVKTGAQGTLFLDNFRSRRSSFIPAF